MDLGDYLELINMHLRGMVALADQETVEQVAERFDEGLVSQVLSNMQDVQTVLVLARRQLRASPTSD